jgi:hypothetical protein
VEAVAVATGTAVVATGTAVVATGTAVACGGQLPATRQGHRVAVASSLSTVAVARWQTSASQRAKATVPVDGGQYSTG